MINVIVCFVALIVLLISALKRVEWSVKHVFGYVFFAILEVSCLIFTLNEYLTNG